MANLKILDEAEGRKISIRDGFSRDCALEALAAGRAAFWSAHRYHDQVSCNAADKANRYGLEVGCQSIVDWAAECQQDAAPHLVRFIAGIFPANSAARAALIAAEAEWLATWTEAAA